ncbi:MAG: hypothetical protein OXD43_01100 [Bacteroidetes bacterium]|nr:hypothetical protein [Bacteroidota bacterium]
MRASDNTEAYELLRKTGLTDVEAFKLIDIIGDMASTNIIARLESKMDAQNAKIDSQTEKYNVLIWVIGFATVILAAVIALT